MRTIQQSVYTFEELSERAKDTARDWYREGIEFDASDMFETFETAAGILGISFARIRNGSGNDPDIRYSGFSSQGDGASFVGSYEFTRGCAHNIRMEFPEDIPLSDIADGLTVLHTRYLLAYGTSLEAHITQDGRYYHKHTMRIEVDTVDGTPVRDVEDVDALSELMRDFAQWIYDSLESEWDYLHSNECVDDSIVTNGYEFNVDGKEVDFLNRSAVRAYQRG